MDDVIEAGYERRGHKKSVSVINAVVDDFSERDQFLRTIQYIKLNGSLPGRPDQLTFAPREYARRSAQFDQWYDHFVRDYSFHPTVFIGSELREPLFWQAIEARQTRGKNPEERPGSFLGTPTISPAKLPLLRELNITHVPAKGSEFFQWLKQNYVIPDRKTLLTAISPESAAVLFQEPLNAKERERIADFLTAFPRVPTPNPQSNRPRNYFLGVAPRWEDIANGFDAPRDTTRSLLAAIDEAWGKENQLGVIGLIGNGGSGKSSILMRAALTTRQGGRLVFFSEGTVRPDLDSTAMALAAFESRAMLFIDNAPLLGPVLPMLLARLEDLDRPPIVVFAARMNLFERQLKVLEKRKDCKVLEVGDLSDSDINGILVVLKANAQLGHLAAMTDAQRFNEFKIRAKKQILVAMREATEGYGFDEIVRNEFGEVDHGEARVLYLCAAVATAELVDLRREQWLACANVSPSDALVLLSRNLKGLLFEEAERVSARHAVVAELIVERIASRAELREAYVRLLNVIAHDIYPGKGRHSRAWRLFVRLIDHRRLFQRFAQDVELARSIFLAVDTYFNNDGHFWLQFANLEIEYGDSRNARPHLAYAQSLMPDHPFVKTTHAHLALRESMEAGTFEAALALKEEAAAILLDQIRASGPKDEYPYHVYISRMLRWIDKWVADPRERRLQLEKLAKLGQEARALHWFSPRIREIADEAQRAYLLTSTSKPSL